MEVTPEMERPVLTDLMMRHILDGEPNDPRRGGHRYGTGRVGKTEFPQSWSDAKIRASIQQAMDRPQWIRIVGTKRIHRRLVDGVIIEVQWFLMADADLPALIAHTRV